MTPEVEIYVDLTGLIPKQQDAKMITEIIRLHSYSKQQLQPFWDGWKRKGYNPKSLAWLVEWAVEKRIGNKSIVPSDPNDYVSGLYADFIDH